MEGLTSIRLAPSRRPLGSKLRDILFYESVEVFVEGGNQRMYGQLLNLFVNCTVNVFRIRDLVLPLPIEEGPQGAA